MFLIFFGEKLSPASSSLLCVLNFQFPMSGPHKYRMVAQQWEKKMYPKNNNVCVYEP